ncbi:hypothetical protein, partial [Endozoicomonas sp. ONNA1]
VLKGSRVEEVVNSAGAIHTGGSHSHGGGIAGSVSDSVIHDSVNTGTVFTTGHASAGGIAGLADQSSSTSNNLNTGKIASRNVVSSPAGGIVGALKSNSVANNNVNTGEVNAAQTESSGGIVGDGTTARILHNLNTGKISSDHHAGTPWIHGFGTSGGIVGSARSQTLVSKNLNTGSISAKSHTHVGGIAGHITNALVVQNANAGSVTTDGMDAEAGGIVGETLSGSIHDNLNAGAVIGKDSEFDGQSPTGGITGDLRNWGSVYNNVNTGLVHARPYNKMSPAVAKLHQAGSIKNNLDTFTRYRQPYDRSDGYNRGVVRVPKSALKSNLNGLNSDLWNAGDATQLPMLKGVNT